MVSVCFIQPCFKSIFCQGNLFFTSYAAWYVGTHESTIFIMRTHWDAINDFMMGKYFHKRLYEYYPQRPVCFVEFLANPSEQTYFLKESSLYIYFLLLVISLFFSGVKFKLLFIGSNHYSCARHNC